MTFPLFRLLTGVEIMGSVPKEGPLILASNHMSYLDPPLIGYTAFREVYFLAKPGLFSGSKCFAWLIKAYNAISIAGTEGLRIAVKLLKQGKAIVIFPEGTRSRRGVLLPFNPGMSYLAISLNIPVVPVHITNSNRKVLSLILRINKLRIRFGNPIFPSGYEKTREGFDRFSLKVREEVDRLR